MKEVSNSDSLLFRKESVLLMNESYSCKPKTICEERCPDVIRVVWPEKALLLAMGRRGLKLLHESVAYDRPEDRKEDQV